LSAVGKSWEPPPELLELAELEPEEAAEVEDDVAEELELIEEPEELDELELIEEPEELELDVGPLEELELDVAELESPPLPPEPLDFEPPQEHAPIAARAKVKSITV